MKETRDLLGFYVHIPFCVQKCNYCDFLSFSGMESMQEKYVAALCQEIELLEEKYTGLKLQETQTDTIYIGGGTPSILNPELIKKILCKLKERSFLSPTAEITIEANPGTLTKEKLCAYHEMGINRLSIGLQSASNTELMLLGRIHTWEEFQQNYLAAREAGFQNINIDIMTALPGQTENRLKQTLEQVLELEPEHISAYSLILEEGTPFYQSYVKEDAGKDNMLLHLPTEEKERSLYYLTRDMLIQYGYHHYEISNFAKPDFESRHNSSYWNRTPYLGLGLGASSLFGDRRFRNVTGLSDYIKSPTEFEEQILLDRAAKMEEFMFLGLRLLRGIEIGAFEQNFQTTLEHEYGTEINKLKKEGLLLEKNGFLSLTASGIDYGNYVFSSFLK